MKIRPLADLRQCTYARKSHDSFLLVSSPSFHGGRGATPAEGGQPSDLQYLAGGGSFPSFATFRFFFPLEEKPKVVTATVGKVEKHAYHQEDSDASLHLSGWRGGTPRLRKKLSGFLLYSWQVKNPSIYFLFLVMVDTLLYVFVLYNYMFSSIA